VNDENAGHGSDEKPPTPHAGPPAPHAFPPPPPAPPKNSPPRAEGPLTRPVAEQAAERARKERLLKAGFVFGGLAFVLLVVWGLTSLLAAFTDAAPDRAAAPTATSTQSPASPEASPLPLPRESVSALDFKLGDCFEDFNPDVPTAKIVACDAPHSAQLIAVFNYPAEDSYPGLNTLRQKGREICSNAKLNAGAANYVLMQRNAYPSDTSWDKGDRRVDCYVTADDGNVIKENLLP
jgi:Septum formation